MSRAVEILSVGHSTHSYERFLRLLRSAGVNAIADVRSSPFSRHHPQFNSDVLQQELKADSVAYVPLGVELGGRPKQEAYFRNGVADYEKMAQAPAFKLGLERVYKGASTYRVALMCSEHDPLDCHRCLLVSRALKAKGAIIRHILSDGKQITQSEVEEKLLREAGSIHEDMFASEPERLMIAYRLRSERIAYSNVGYAKRVSTR